MACSQAIKAFNEKLAIIRAQLKTLEAGIQEYQDDTPDRDVHWGHVGDMCSVEVQLKNVCNFLSLE